jgi:hypothetical protein
MQPVRSYPGRPLAGLLSLSCCLACAGPALPPGPEAAGARAPGASFVSWAVPPDQPDFDPVDACLERRDDALAGARSSYTEAAIRWSCADVEGVTTEHRDDRGEEYCEYFAVVVPPPASPGSITPPAALLGRSDGRPDALTLTEYQRELLDERPGEVVGHCVFTSWFGDVPGPVPACSDPAHCPTLHGIRLTAADFRMQQGFNELEDAVALLRDCMDPVKRGELLAQLPFPGADELARSSDYFRGCMLDTRLYNTGWRRSDPTICAAFLRVAECRCSLDGASDLVTALLPPQPRDGQPGPVTLRGFPLGSWDDLHGLPPGCRHVDLGDGSQTVVTCPLKAADVLGAASDLKESCRRKYAEEIVVHIPLAGRSFTCGDAACPARPWAVDN